MKMELRAVTAANRETWEASARFHEEGERWAQLLERAGKPGFSVLDDCITQTLRAIGIEGRRAAQVCCNNGRELLSLASLGAIPVLGIDHSGSFLRQGERLAKAAGLSPRLLEADIYDLPEDVGTYDLVLITIGVINWMPDVKRFFEIVAGLLAPGGVLVIYETHPFMEMFEPASETPFLPMNSYFKDTPHVVTQSITYDGVDHGPAATGYWFAHSLGDTVTACVEAGLRLERLTEHPHSNREPDYDIYCNQEAQIPMCYTLIARK